MGDEARLLRWEACYNARDIGGYPTGDRKCTRWGALIRSDNLSRLTPSGRAALIAAGVRTIVDLRSPYELGIDPPPFRSSQDGVGPRYLNIAFFTETAARATAGKGDMTERYHILVDLARREIAGIVTAIARAEEGGVLIHCHSGKDRTGILIALLLALVDVPRDIIAEDYALSATCLQAKREQEMHDATNDEHRRLIQEAFTCPPARILSTLDHIDATYGSVEMYLLSSGVSPADIEHLREQLVDTSPP